MDDKVNGREITLDSLINEKNDTESTLYQFSNFIAGNPDFKYNSTYLTDEIARFIIERELFIKKNAFFIDIIKSLTKVKKVNVDILFDNVFCFNILDNDCYRRNKINYKEFKFDKFGSKKVIIEFISNNEKSTFLISDFEEMKEKKEILKKYKEFIKQINK